MSEDDFKVFDEMDRIFDETFPPLEEGELDLDRAKIEVVGKNIDEEKIEKVRKKVEDLFGDRKDVSIEISFGYEEAEEE